MLEEQRLRQGPRRSPGQARAQPARSTSSTSTGRARSFAATSASRSGPSGRSSRSWPAAADQPRARPPRPRLRRRPWPCPSASSPPSARTPLADYAGPQHGHPRALGARASGSPPSSSSCPPSGGAGARPSSSPSSVDDPWAHIAQFIIPAFILGIASAAAIMRLTRAPCSSRCSARTTCAPRGPRGCASASSCSSTASRTPLIPVVTVLGIQIAQILGGVVIFEHDLRPARHGALPLRRHQSARLPVIQGVNLVIVSVVVVMNLIVDAMLRAPRPEDPVLSVMANHVETLPPLAPIDAPPAGAAAPGRRAPSGASVATSPWAPSGASSSWSS